MRCILVCCVCVYVVQASELAAIFQMSSHQILKEERSALTKLRSAPKSSSLRDYAELLSVVS
jgi:hypothetical protein